MICVLYEGYHAVFFRVTRCIVCPPRKRLAILDEHAPSLSTCFTDMVLEPLTKIGDNNDLHDKDKCGDSNVCDIHSGRNWKVQTSWRWKVLCHSWTVDYLKGFFREREALNSRQNSPYTKLLMRQISP